MTKINLLNGGDTQVKITEPTVNAAMVAKKQLESRKRDLDSVRSATCNKETRFFGGGEQKITEPEYDVKKVDSKIVQLQNAIFMIDLKIKESNAVTKISGLEIDLDTLMSPLEGN